MLHDSHIKAYQLMKNTYLDKYEEICKSAKSAESGSIDKWYLKTERIFKGQKINCEDDFLKLVAYAYSWMPTIPEWHDLNWAACETALEKLKGGESGALKEALLLIVPSINNSIVGSSKVLHFACPDHAPIIDSNVVIGWRALFFPGGLRKKRNVHNEYLAALPSNFCAYGSDKKNKEKQIDLYIKYSENLKDWANVLKDVTPRDIEIKLYMHGKKQTDKAN